MKTLEVKAGNIVIGGDHSIAIQTMCNTHTYDIARTVSQCIEVAEAGAKLIRITVPGPKDVESIKSIKEILVSKDIDTPIVADIHFSSQTALLVAPFVDKVRINPGNFHRDHEEAKRQFAKFLVVCKEHNTAVRIGLNHGSLGDYITNLYGNSSFAMAKAAMEWIEMCISNDFYNVVVSLKSSNTIIMVEAYRILAKLMKERGVVFPLHLGVTEAGNGDSGRIKSCVGISSLLSEGIGNTIRVSLTEEPVNELPVASYLARRYSPDSQNKIYSSMTSINVSGKKASAVYDAPSREKLIMDASCDLGKRLLDKELDEIEISGTYLENGNEVSIKESGIGEYLCDEIMQAARRRFYKPEYIACPGCGRTMYDLQETFEEVKKRTSHLKDTVIAVMGCIVNGPGEMADADWGYVGEGNRMVTIYRKHIPVLKHIPDNEAIDRLLELIEAEKSTN